MLSHFAVAVYCHKEISSLFSCTMFSTITTPRQPNYFVSCNDDFLMSAFRQGNKDAFQSIYNKINGSLTYYIQNIIHSQTDAEDIAANAFSKLFQAREKLSTLEHVKRWIYVIARNEAIDLLRLRTRQRNLNKEIYYLSDDIEDSIETEMMKTSLLKIVASAIEKLPRQRKKILRLYFFEKKTTHEIAAMLQLNSQTVLNHKAKALEALRKTVPAPAYIPF